jgi:hypothetical protein
MANPLYHALNGNQNMSTQNLAREFENFRRGFRGDARQIVQNMLNSGQMTQAQFNQLAAQANQLSQILGR